MYRCDHKIDPSQINYPLPIIKLSRNLNVDVGSKYLLKVALQIYTVGRFGS